MVMARMLGWFQSPSLRGSGRFVIWGLAGYRLLLVSIPFIAGQWSLLEVSGAAAILLAVFQSPSLRGSGRFETWS